MAGATNRQVSMMKHVTIEKEELIKGNVRTNTDMPAQVECGCASYRGGEVCDKKRGARCRVD